MPDAPNDPLAALAERLQRYSTRLNAMREIQQPSPSSRVPVLGPLINLLSRLLNRLATHWYIAPTLDQQQRFYEEVTAAFDELARLAVLHEQHIASVQDREGELNRRIEEVREQLAVLARPAVGKDYAVTLDYPLNPRPRYGWGRPPHAMLYDIIARNRDSYRQCLTEFLSCREGLARISREPSTSTEPSWANDFLCGLDVLSLYGFLGLTRPARYFEVGSGNSTKFARRAIEDYGLSTKITSIDPCPREEVDSICDLVIRQRLEEVDVRIFDLLEAGDILFVDDSHRVQMNSDATVAFLEVLPRLRPGILVGFHDIPLPSDYPDEWVSRFYNEQYVLAAYLLAGGNRFDIVLPCAFVSDDPELSGILTAFWEGLQVKRRYGSAFWIRTR